MPEEDDQQPEQMNRDLTVQIVVSYVAGNKLPPSEVAHVVATVHQALAGLGELTEPVVERSPAVSIRRSIQPDYIVCLECGHRAKTLKRHISSRHSLSIAEYRDRWNLKPDYPMVAPAYAAHRSTLAKQLGLGRKRLTEPEAPAPQQSRRRGRGRSKSTSTA